MEPKTTKKCAAERLPRNEVCCARCLLLSERKRKVLGPMLMHHHHLQPPHWQRQRVQVKRTFLLGCEMVMLHLLHQRSPSQGH